MNVESHVNIEALEPPLGRLDAAEAEYYTAIRLQPMFVPAYINLSDPYRQQGRDDRVIETLQRAVQLGGVIT
jgi:hypothetical protein